VAVANASLAIAADAMSGILDSSDTYPAIARFPPNAETASMHIAVVLSVSSFPAFRETQAAQFVGEFARTTGLSAQQFSAGVGSPVMRSLDLPASLAEAIEVCHPFESNRQEMLVRFAADRPLVQLVTAL